MPPAYEVLLLNTAIPQIQAAQSGDTYVVPRDIAINATAIISANSATDALRITQTGAGNAILVEDSANPDSSPFVVTATGDVGIGTSSPAAKLQVAWSSDQLKFTNPSAGFKQIGASYTGYVSGDDYSAIILGTNGSSGGKIQFSTMPSGGALTTAATIDQYGNLGLGVTPSASWSGQNAFQIGGASLSYGSGVGLANNAVFTSSGFAANYLATGASALYLQGAGTHTWFNAPSGTAGNAISFTQAMTLDASGNLLVGNTADPIGGSRMLVQSAGTIGNNRTFTVYNTAATSTTAFANRLVMLSSLGNGADVTIQFTDSIANNAYIGMGAGALYFATGGTTERARITSGGDLLVGTTDSSPIGNGVKGIVLNGTDARFDINRNGNTPMFVGRFTSSGTLIDFFYAGVSKGSISTDGTNVAYNTSSDYRLKDNQQPLTGSGAFIDALKPKTWDWKSGGKGVGFIAHEVQEVSPGSVVGEKDAVNADGKPIMQAMEYGSAEFIANIIAELQSLRARVAQLEQGA